MSMKPLSERLAPATLEMLKALPKQELTEGQKEWIAALRSGEFQQARGYLHKDGKFCCLGVRCEQLARKGELPYTDIKTSRVYATHETTLPTEVSALDHFYDGFGYFGRHGQYKPLRVLLCKPGEDTIGAQQVNDLATLNDEGLATFEDIAWLVETYPALVFYK